MRKRPNSRFTFFAPVNVLFYFYSMGGPIRGNDAMSTFRENPNIVTFESHKGPICFFFCLAGFRAIQQGERPRNLAKPAKHLLSVYCDASKIHPNAFDGIDMLKLGFCEKLFKIGIQVVGSEYRGPNHKPRYFTLRKAEIHKNNKMYVMLHENHFMLIRDITRLCGMFECASCYHVSNRIDNYRRHSSACTGKRSIKYQTGTYHPRQSIVAQLQMLGVNLDEEDFHNNAVIVFDFEVELKETVSFAKNSDNTHFTEEHLPLSVAVCSNIDGFRTPECFFNPSNCSKIIEDFLQYAVTASFGAQEAFRDQIEYVFEQLDDMESEAEHAENKPLCQQIRNIATRLDNFVNRTPIVGFNSSRYDLRAVKHAFFPILDRIDKIRTCVKKDGAYLAVICDFLM